MSLSLHAIVECTHRWPPLNSPPPLAMYMTNARTLVVINNKDHIAHINDHGKRCTISNARGIPYNVCSDKSQHGADSQTKVGVNMDPDGFPVINNSCNINWSAKYTGSKVASAVYLFGS